MAYTINAKTKGITEASSTVQPVTKKQVREFRDKLLIASDWTQVADAPVDQTAWATYRQALRDIPKQEGFPENVIWPERP
jgi:hypothetical protein